MDNGMNYVRFGYSRKKAVQYVVASILGVVIMLVLLWLSSKEADSSTGHKLMEGFKLMVNGYNNASIYRILGIVDILFILLSVIGLISMFSHYVLINEDGIKGCGQGPFEKINYKFDWADVKNCTACDDVFKIMIVRNNKTFVITSRIEEATDAAEMIRKRINRQNS